MTQKRAWLIWTSQFNSTTQWKYLKTLHEPSEQLTVHLYLVSAWTGIPINRQPDEHSEIGWFTLAETAQLPLANPNYPALFAHYLPIADD